MIFVTVFYEPGLLLWAFLWERLVSLRVLVLLMFIDLRHIWLTVFKVFTAFIVLSVLYPLAWTCLFVYIGGLLCECAGDCI